MRSDVTGDVTSNRSRTACTPTVCSISASCWPAHLRGPLRNGRKARGFAVASEASSWSAGSQRSGQNSLGREKWSGCVCMACSAIPISVPGGRVTPSTVMGRPVWRPVQSETTWRRMTSLMTAPVRVSFFTSERLGALVKPLEPAGALPSTASHSARRRPTHSALQGWARRHSMQAIENPAALCAPCTWFTSAAISCAPKPASHIERRPSLASAESSSACTRATCSSVAWSRVGAPKRSTTYEFTRLRILLVQSTTRHRPSGTAKMPPTPSEMPARCLP
mmetsp:Transcript_12406/g.47768  ORF Transcript_12406/g.47768 Transcript_12406/m.47768 type:complete len:279 (-) Transcript_12406:690-1526(-)